MNRKIKFRGKRKDGEWIYGYYSRTDKGPEGIEDVIQYTGGYDEVLPETVGQFIGFYDANFTEIYEGDILQEQTTHPIEVFIQEGHLYGRFEDMGEVIEDMLFMGDIMDEGLEVVGNIHEGKFKKEDREG